MPGLRWSAVDLRRGVIRLFQGETKNDEGRTVTIAGPLAEIMARREAVRLVERRDGEPRVADLVFRKDLSPIPRRSPRWWAPTSVCIGRTAPATGHSRGASLGVGYATHRIAPSARPRPGIRVASRACGRSRTRATPCRRSLPQVGLNLVRIARRSRRPADAQRTPPRRSAFTSIAARPRRPRAGRPGRSSSATCAPGSTPSSARSTRSSTRT